MSRFPQANKRLGQHFLHDQGIINQICADFKSLAASIIEVGPGPGVLTSGLSEHSMPFRVIERDERFSAYLNKYLAPEHIQFCDALEVDFENFIRLHDLPPPIWLVSNLPYNISVPLLLRFVRCPPIEFMTLMFQKEVGNKIFNFDEQKKSGMGSLMSLSQNFFDTKLLVKVPPGAFSPPPKVDSVVLSFTRKKNPVVPLEQFEEFECFLRKLFQYKRKKIAKGLVASYRIDTIHRILEENDVDQNARAESLDLETIQNIFIQLTNEKRNGN